MGDLFQFRSILLEWPDYFQQRGSNEGDYVESLPRMLASLLEEAVRLSVPARIERPPLHREGSASKKDGLAAPSLLLYV